MVRRLACALVVCWASLSTPVAAQEAPPAPVVTDAAQSQKRYAPNRARFSAGIGEAVFWEGSGYSAFATDVGGSLALDWQVLLFGPQHWFTIGPHVGWTHQAALTTGVAGVTLGVANALDTTGTPRWPPFSVDFVLGAALVEDRRPSGVGFAFGWELGVRATAGYLVADGVGVLVGFEAAWIVGAQYDSLFLGGHLGYLGEWL